MLACTALSRSISVRQAPAGEIALENAGKQRAALEAYTPRSLGVALAVTGTATAVTYVAYTLDPATCAFFNSIFLLLVADGAVYVVWHVRFPPAREWSRWGEGSRRSRRRKRMAARRPVRPKPRPVGRVVRGDCHTSCDQWVRARVRARVRSVTGIMAIPAYHDTCHHGPGRMKLSDSIRFYCRHRCRPVCATTTRTTSSVDKKLGLFIVADGDGGHAAVRSRAPSPYARSTRRFVARRSSSTTTSPARPARASHPKDVVALLEHAVQRVLQDPREAAADANKRGMGTTAERVARRRKARGSSAHVGRQPHLLARPTAFSR